MAALRKALHYRFTAGRRVPVINFTAGLVVLIALSLSAQVTAQTVSGVAPVSTGSNYIVSSSPMPNGGMVRTTYYPSQSSMGTSSRTEVARVGTASPANFYPPQNVQPISRNSEVIGSLNGGWRSVSASSQNIVTTRASTVIDHSALGSSVPTAPTMIATTAYRQPVQGTQDPNYYSAPPASQQPTLPTNSSTLQGGTSAPVTGTAVPAAQSTLNWQTTNGQLYNPNIVYPANTAYNPCAPYTNYRPTTAYSVPVRTNYKPILPLRSLPGTAYVGQGLYGQPKAYVEGESVRNFFRYILP